MAKPSALAAGLLMVLLALKSELWQSEYSMWYAPDSVLLALKSELWQSSSSEAFITIPVLLALKSELWQSFISSECVRAICFARIKIGTMAKLGGEPGRARQVLLALKSELWQSFYFVPSCSWSVLLALKSELWQS